jgi:hypothetical protein
MASVCLKNAIDKYWRKTAPNSIKEEERQLFKAQFLQYLNEPELRLARQMSVILGKLARFELPHQWPDLITKLIQILQESSAHAHQTASSTNGTSNIQPGPALASLLALAPTQQQHQPAQIYSIQNINSQQNIIQNRSLMALHQIIKSLASKRLVNDRKIFEELALNLIDMLSQLAFFYVQKCLLNPIGEVDLTGGDEQVLKASLQEHYFYLDQSIISLKILHKLVLHGFKDNTENVFLNQLIVNLLQSFDKLLTKYNRIIATNDQTLVDYFKGEICYIKKGNPNDNPKNKNKKFGKLKLKLAKQKKFKTIQKATMCDVALLTGSLVSVVIEVTRGLGSIRDRHNTTVFTCYQWIKNSQPWCCRFKISLPLMLWVKLEIQTKIPETQTKK